MINEYDIVNALADLRGLKGELKEQKSALKELECEIDGLEDDIVSSRNQLDNLIEKYLDEGKELPQSVW